jgi:predicted MFS family arabinose efflux permease
VLGCGDALTFVSVVRVAAQDFPRHRFPLAVSVTSMLGMVGNLAATIPLTLLLRSAGWTLSFAGTGLVTLVTGAAVWILLPTGRNAAAPRQPAPAGRMCRSRSACACSPWPAGRCCSAASAAGHRTC